MVSLVKFFWIAVDYFIISASVDFHFYLLHFKAIDIFSHKHFHDLLLNTTGRNFVLANYYYFYFFVMFVLVANNVGSQTAKSWISGYVRCKCKQVLLSRGTFHCPYSGSDIKQNGPDYVSFLSHFIFKIRRRNAVMQSASKSKRLLEALYISSPCVWCCSTCAPPGIFQFQVMTGLLLWVLLKSCFLFDLNHFVAMT